MYVMVNPVWPIDSVSFPLQPPVEQRLLLSDEQASQADKVGRQRGPTKGDILLLWEITRCRLKKEGQARPFMIEIRGRHR